MQKVLLRIYGRVQGVCYRAWAIGEATRRGLAGWVRNRRDGTVEALLAGGEDAIADMVRACWEGPPAADVTEIEVRTTNEETGEGFTARPTA
ncbi:MAG: acylphosphatase [Alphaproteobacteria bacterium]|nr:acylphosphatase [Alphaproteobacteria bacterium]